MDNIETYLNSGILELYALGALGEAEAREVEQLMQQHPELRAELGRVEETLEQMAMEQAVEPPSGLKGKIERELYLQQSGAGKKYAPLISTGATFEEIYAWAVSMELQPPANPEETVVVPMESTSQVVNLLAWSKEGHPLETHDSYIEYIVVLEGACSMFFNGVKSEHSKGEIIRIPLHTEHCALVTSEEPMWALVQREML